MDLTVVANVLGLLKHIPENLASILVLGAIVISFVLHRKSADVTNATAIGELQNKQLETLIKMNQALSEQLHSVREELSEAYTVIDQLRTKVTELEELIQKKQKEQP